MFGCAWLAGYGFWWIFPLIMIAMIAFCFFMMRRLGMGYWMGRCPRNRYHLSDEDAPSSK